MLKYFLLNWLKLFRPKVSLGMVRRNRTKGELLQLGNPVDDMRGKKRKFSDADLKVVKRELKRRRSTPTVVQGEDFFFTLSLPA